MTFGSSVLGGNITDFDKKRLERIIYIGSSLIGISQDSFKDMAKGVLSSEAHETLKGAPPKTMFFKSCFSLIKTVAFVIK